MSNGDQRSKHVDAFIGISSTEGAEVDDEPSFQLALDRAAQLAAEAGYAGREFNVSVEIVPEAHNQWIRTYKVIITPGG